LHLFQDRGMNGGFQPTRLIFRLTGFK